MRKTCNNCYYGGNGKKSIHGTVLCKKRYTKVSCGKQRNNCKDWRSGPPVERPHMSYTDIFKIGW